MAHLPINHRLGGFYMILTTVVAVFLLGFGIVGIARTAGSADDVEVLNVKTSLGLSILVLLLGIACLLLWVLGRHLRHFVAMALGGALVAASLFVLAILRTSANVLHATVPVCVAGMVIGVIVLLTGLYSKTGPPSIQRSEEQFRHRDPFQGRSLIEDPGVQQQAEHPDRPDEFNSRDEHMPGVMVGQQPWQHSPDT